MCAGIFYRNDFREGGDFLNRLKTFPGHKKVHCKEELYSG